MTSKAGLPMRRSRRLACAAKSTLRTVDVGSNCNVAIRVSSRSNERQVRFLFAATLAGDRARGPVSLFAAAPIRWSPTAGADFTAARAIKAIRMIHHPPSVAGKMVGDSTRREISSLQISLLFPRSCLRSKGGAQELTWMATGGAEKASRTARFAICARRLAPRFRVDLALRRYPQPAWEPTDQVGIDSTEASSPLARPLRLGHPAPPQDGLSVCCDWLACLITV